MQAYRMRKIIYQIIVVLSLFFICAQARSQVTITGPTCVVPGTVYQYSISANWDSTSTMRVCVNGGSIADSVDSNECTVNGIPIARVLVDWDTSGNWSLTVSSSLGNATINVYAILPLLPGSIDSASKTQMIGLDSVPLAITCSAGSGGSCSPTFMYQWQQSYDMQSWADMPGKTSQSLSIDSGLTQSAYYRRKVTEIGSNTISYSDAASVFVIEGTALLNRKKEENLYAMSFANGQRKNNLTNPN